MEKLGRYYTSDLFSQLLVDSLSTTNPQNIVELGVGGGALVKAAINRWVDASYYVADVDIDSLSKIKKELPFINSFHFDTIKENVSQKLNVNLGSVDIAVCNPPYLKLKNGIRFNNLFEEAKLSECQKLRQLTTDIIFLAKNLQLLKTHGELGIILPDSLITGKEFENLRRAILKEHNLKGIIQLPEKIFPKTEALTYILFMEKGKIENTPTSLFLADKKGKIIDQTEVDKSALIERMDFKFHAWKKSNFSKRRIATFKTLKVEIKRGNLTHKELKQTDEDYAHTTNIKHLNPSQIFHSVASFNKQNLLTQKGDILLSRVGTIGKVAMVSEGKVPISDCIYRIRVSSKYRDAVWKALISDKGQNWFHANSHGVCAKVISKEDLLNFPVSLH